MTIHKNPVAQLQDQEKLKLDVNSILFKQFLFLVGQHRLSKGGKKKEYMEIVGNLQRKRQFYLKKKQLCRS